MTTKPFRLLLACLLLSPGAVTAEDAAPVLLIHGGAGTLRAADMSAADRAAYEAALHTALEAGWQVLAEGGTALDAVTAAILPMEDSPLFNAGRGAVFTADGHNELDASIMDGATRAAGAVGGVRRVVLDAADPYGHRGLLSARPAGAHGPPRRVDSQRASTPAHLSVAVSVTDGVPRCKAWLVTRRSFARRDAGAVSPVHDTAH